MKKHILCIFLIVFGACNEKSKLFRYELKVVNGTDSAQNFNIFTDFNNDYDFFDDSLRDSIIFSKSSLSKVEGDFTFGLINNKQKNNKILFFKSQTGKFPIGKINNRELVMLSEFENLSLIEDTVSFYCFDDHLDTTDIYPSRQISNVITCSDGLDTIGFQENVYIKRDEQLITTILLYTNSTFKEELKLVAKELKSK